MKIYRNVNEIPHNTNRAITVGSFDGIHLGHLQILKNLKSNAQKNNLTSMVITFEPHPQIYFSAKTNTLFPLLTTVKEKIYFLELLGIDELFIINFDEEIANIEPVEFVNYLKNIGFSLFVIGYNHSFGKNRKGNWILLEKINEISKSKNEEPFKIVQVPRFTITNSKVSSNAKISSTEIRRILRDCNVENANELLGHYYFVSGNVEKGSGVGKTIGFPTANIYKTNNKLLPRNGVYACKIELLGKNYFGVANIGYRPTVANTSISKNSSPVLEVHIFDFAGDIYDITVLVSFVRFLREEKKFNNKSELIQQISDDVAFCRRIFGLKNW